MESGQSEFSANAVQEQSGAKTNSADALGDMRSLLYSVNVASGAARNMWLFFLAIMAYFFVAIASVTHSDLLLNSPVRLPILGIDLNLRSFFLFGPLVLLFVHFGLLVQHVMLSLKIVPLGESLSALEDGKRKNHPLRLELSSYFYSQALAGSSRSPIFGLFLHGMVWLTLVATPVFIFLFFQIVFLPYHDVSITWAHRIYLALDILILIGIGIFLRKPEASFWRALWRTGRHHPFNMLSGVALFVLALFLSFFVITVPDEWLDVKLRNLPGFKTELTNSSQAKSSGPRFAFAVTALLMERDRILAQSGIPLRFQRNLTVTDKDLVPNKDDIHNEVSLNLRDRNLRYARLDRSDLHRADFAGADLTGASLINANLRDVNMSCPGEQEEDLTGQAEIKYCTKLVGANLSKADLRNARLNASDLTKANLEDVTGFGLDLQQANLSDAKLSRIKLAGANLSFAKLSGADLSWSNLQGVEFSAADLQRTNFEHAELHGARLDFTKMENSNLAYAKLYAADLSGANLYGANLSNAALIAADLRHAVIWSTQPPGQGATTLADFTILNIKNSGAQAESARTPEQIAEDKTWGENEGYRKWSALKAASSARDVETYKTELSNYLAKMICMPRGDASEISTSLVRRAISTSFNGNVNIIYTQLQNPDCAAKDVITAELRQQLASRAGQ